LLDLTNIQVGIYALFVFFHFLQLVIFDNYLTKSIL